MDVHKYLHQLLAKVPDLIAIVISDREGVPVIKASKENAPELAMRSTYLATIGMATDQAGKLGIGKNKAIVCMYKNNQVIHLNRQPLVVTLIALSNANTGMLMQLVNDLNHFVEDLKMAVD